jgi:ABC-type amino acid transport substrate-binding protein
MLRALSLFVAFFASLAAASAQDEVPSGSRLKSIVDGKVIRIAYRTDATPFSFVNPQTEAVGYSVDVCKFVVKSIEQQFGLQGIKIEWVPVTVQTRFSAIADGKADMECGSSTVTLGRMKQVDFSNTIFVESTGVIVARKSNIGGFGDMNKKKIAVISGTTNEHALMREIGAHNLEIALVGVKDRDEGVAALESGNVDGYASDKLLLIGAQIKHPEALTMLPDDLSVEPYGIALPRGDWALRLAVNIGLSQVYRSGAIIAVYQRWFGQLGLQPGVLLRAAYTFGALPE